MTQQMSAMGLPLRLPADAHHTLYVEGVPGDASEREMAHIFRPFPGYISLRLRAKGGRSLGLSSGNADAICFVEFESPYHVSYFLESFPHCPLSRAVLGVPVARFSSSVTWD